jgi:hypothetical protein
MSAQKSAIYTSDLKDYNKAVALFNDINTLPTYI